MNRKKFLHSSLLATGSLTVLPDILAMENKPDKKTMPKPEKAPRAITMWEFSWLERRWPGAGYENWDIALDGLVERGYNAVRIDPFPHLLALGKEKTWTLKPVWNQQDWGSPGLNKVQIQPALNQFIAKCGERGIKVGLSTWYREDLDNSRMKISSAKVQAEQWMITLDSIRKDELIPHIFYVDLCNEWPGNMWCPFFVNDPPELTWGGWHTKTSMNWMNEAIALVRKEFPELPLSYSFHTNEPHYVLERDLSFLDYLDPHIWMAQENGDEYYKAVGYRYDRFIPDSYQAMVENGEKIFYQKADYWKKLLTDKIKIVGEHARKKNIPLMTTECWGVVDYKDFPLLPWGYIKELCALGTRTASETSQWLAIATSNFCGPQFHGMWDDVQWHRELTDLIRNAPIHESLKGSILYKRI